MLGSIISSLIASTASKLRQDYEQTEANKKKEAQNASEASQRLAEIAIEKQRAEEELSYQRAKKSKLLKADLATLRSKIASSGILSSDATSSILLQEKGKQGEEDMKAQLNSYVWNLEDLDYEAFRLKPLLQGFIKAYPIRKAGTKDDEEENKTYLI